MDAASPKRRCVVSGIVDGIFGVAPKTVHGVNLGLCPGTGKRRILTSAGDVVFDDSNVEFVVDEAIKGIKPAAWGSQVLWEVKYVQLASSSSSSSDKKENVIIAVRFVEWAPFLTFHSWMQAIGEDAAQFTVNQDADAAEPEDVGSSQYSDDTDNDHDSGHDA